MTEAEQTTVAELVSGLEEARTVLEECASQMTKLPGDGGMTGIKAKSAIKRITMILENAVPDPLIVTPSE